jgi:hypothetical protein
MERKYIPETDHSTETAVIIDNGGPTIHEAILDFLTAKSERMHGPAWPGIQLQRQVERARELPARRDLLGPFLHSSSLGFLFGAAGAGKSTFLYDMALRIASGNVWPDAEGATLGDRDMWRHEPRPGGERVLYFDVEMNAEDLLERHGKTDAHPNFQVLFGEDIPAEHSRDRLGYVLRNVDAQDISVLFIDNLSALVPEANKELNMRAAADEIKAHQKRRRDAGRPLAVMIAAHILKGQQQQIAQADRPVSLFDMQGASYAEQVATVILGYQPHPEMKQGAVLQVLKSRGTGQRDLKGSAFSFYADLTPQRNVVHYDGRRPVAELFGRGRMSGPRIENEREKIARIADALRSSSGWASTRAVWEQYKAEGGARGYRSVADDLKLLGKTNPEPAPMRTSRTARDEHEQQLLEMQQAATDAHTLTLTASNVPTDEHDHTPRGHEPGTTTGAEVAPAATVGGLSSGGVGHVEGRDTGRRAVAAHPARPPRV